MSEEPAVMMLFPAVLFVDACELVVVGPEKPRNESGGGT